MIKTTVADIMHTNPVSARIDQPLIDVVEVLSKHRLMGIPVVDDNKQVVGFISEQDCIQSLLATSYFCEGNPRVGDVMSRESLNLRPGDSVVDLARRMGRGKPKVYPVVDEGRLVGLVSRSDVLGALREEARACATQGHS